MNNTNLNKERKSLDDFMDFTEMYKKLGNEQKYQVNKMVQSMLEPEEPYRNCRFFDKCSAPICPMDNRKTRMIWYAGEDICSNPDYSNEKFIISQKKIARKKPDVYFNYSMLNRDYTYQVNHIKNLKEIFIIIRIG